jgi:CheY-like chemotaxis protein
MRCGKTALFVDDELATLDAYKEALEADGVVVEGAFTAQDALNFLRENSVDLILLDIMMPYYGIADLLKMGREAVRTAPEQNVWTGLRFYREAKKNWPKTPIVIYSALPEADIRTRAKQLDIDLPGTVPCLGKGVTSPQKIIETLRRYLR